MTKGGSEPRRSLRIAVDTGGTFTDVAVSRPDGTMHVWKVPSTPAAPEEGVLDGLTDVLRDLSAAPGDIGRFVHGTTVATNTLLTRTGGRVGLVTTAGFADLLAIGRQTRPSLYDQRVRREPPLVGPEHTWELEQRIAGDGSILTPVDPDQVRAVTDDIAAADLDSVVVSLINGYAAPTEESTVAEQLRAADVAPAVFAATEISPEIREYERTSTAVINSYVQPRIASYLQRLESRLTDRGVPCRIWVMQSNGGLLGVDQAQQQSVRTVLSGLAGGVVGAAAWARQLDLDSVVSFDIGGTSTDIALIRDGRPVEMTSTEIAGHPLLLPVVDVHTIGAGGGSIAWQDSGGGLRVGPHSAGAVPGPVSYGAGGTDITVTDAHAVLGRLGRSLLGGRLTLDVDEARVRMKALAAELDLEEDEAATGVLRVINATMARGVRKVSVERGVDLRECTLLAFGGAGPLHAADLVRELGMRGAVVPPHPGIASAIGMLDAPVRHDFAVNVGATDQAQLADVDDALACLEQRARSFLAEEESLDADATVVTRAVDAHYVGQSYELTIDWSPDFAAVRASFDKAHELCYGFADEDAEVEVVTARVTAVLPDPGQRTTPESSRVGDPQPIGHRAVHFDGEWCETPVYDRTDIPAGKAMSGPLILEQLDSTVVVGPGQRCSHDRFGFAHIDVVSA